MKKIEIDEEVFELLTKNAEPFIDTPNTVLRRLLQMNKKNSSQKNNKVASSNESSIRHNKVDTVDFVNKFLINNFPEEYFHRKERYRFMFESKSKLIYFQNYNKSNRNLWYRVTDKPWATLNTTNKESYLCLTNPEEGIAYLFPVDDIIYQIKKSDWSRNYLEINIDYSYHRWREFNWNIKEYLERIV